MKVLTNYYVHGFLIAVIIIFYILTVYFNYKAFKIAIENKTVNVYPQPGSCNYPDINVVNDKCSKSNLYYITIDKLIYTLSTNDSNPTTVCKVLCEKYDATSSNPCQGNTLQINQYNQCVNTLQPAKGCAGLARPLAYRYNTTTNQQIDFYANEVLTNIDDCN